MPAKKKAATKVPEGTEEGNDLVIPEFKVVNNVSLPVLKWSVGNTIYVTFDRAIETKPSKDKKGEDTTIDVAKVTDLVQKQAFDLVCGVALKKKLEEEYGEEDYVGKSFKMTKHKVAGKDYNNFEIYEIEL